jgi:hypothetical protein
MNQELKQNGFYYANFLKSVDGENRLAFIVLFRIDSYLCLDITPTEELVNVDQGLIEHIREWRSLISGAISDGSIESPEAKEKFAKLNIIRPGVFECLFYVDGLEQRLTLTSAFNKISANLESKGFRPLLGQVITNTIFSGLLLDFQETEKVQVVNVDEISVLKKEKADSFFDRHSSILLRLLIIGMLLMIIIGYMFSPSKDNKKGYSDNNYQQQLNTEQSLTLEHEKRIADSISQAELKIQDSIDKANKYELDSIQAEANRALERVLAKEEKRKAEMRKSSPYMTEYSSDFPLEFVVPGCPNYVQGALNSSGCVLILYYAKSGQTSWREFPGTESVSRGMMDNTFHFFGRKGWKYAYSWGGGNTRPIRLNPINVKQTWSVQ